jgi:NAD(P)-dependent dehydrogenase (short-subunit alcohol dehydrogenase family)
MALNNPFDFSGKSIVLTGAAGGLGRPITIAFAQAGAHVALCDRNEKGLSDLANEIKENEGEVIAESVELCSQKEVQGFVDLVLDKFEKIDVLVNLVGGIIRRPSIEYHMEDWEHIMDINLKACWVCCQAVGKVMIAQKGGRIINFSSNAGIHGVPGYPAYSPAKAGVIALTRVLAVEWGPFGICTNALAPGFTKTPLNEEVLKMPERVEGILKRMPLGEVLPDDSLVGPTLFLASDAARWINGHTLNVDAGFNIT